MFKWAQGGRRPKIIGGAQCSDDVTGTVVKWQNMGVAKAPQPPCTKLPWLTLVQQMFPEFKVRAGVGFGPQT